MRQVRSAALRNVRSSLALAVLLACCVHPQVASTAPPATPAKSAKTAKVPQGPGWVAPQTGRYDRAALAQVAERVAAAKAAGKTPVVVFDLDHTLFDGRPRTLVILAEWAASIAAEQPAVAAAVGRIPLQGISYLLRDTLAAVGVTDARLVAAAEAYWKPRFFSDAYAALDVPIAGASAYVQDLWRRGAVVVYLSGRNADGMLSGTTASLQKWGFPVGVRATAVVLKPSFAEPDDTFKKASLDQISALGAVVASFENEPGNLGVMAARWPDALPIFLDTDFNPGGAVKTPPAAARWVGDYTTAPRPAGPTP
ncbi:MAG: hypothetical protein JNL82_06180 [Myxococcales bacterium]|nr:hypothetical protein [Myxococcales bacterium]